MKQLVDYPAFLVHKLKGTARFMRRPLLPDSSCFPPFTSDCLAERGKPASRAAALWQSREAAGLLFRSSEEFSAGDRLLENCFLQLRQVDVE